jgi:hypothetical protein
MSNDLNSGAAAGGCCQRWTTRSWGKFDLLPNVNSAGDRFTVEARPRLAALQDQQCWGGIHCLRSARALAHRSSYCKGRSKQRNIKIFHKMSDKHVADAAQYRQ